MTDWQSLYDQGYQAASQGSIEIAEEFLKKAIEEASNENLVYELTKSLNALGIVYQNIGRIDEARELFERAIELKVDDGELGNSYSGLAQVHVLSDEIQKAVELFGNAIEIFELNGQSLDILDVENTLISILPDVTDLVEVNDLTEDERQEFKEARKNAFSILGFEKGTTPDKVVLAIDNYIDKVQEDILEDPDLMDTQTMEAYDLAILWGHQLIKQFGWQWKYVSVDGVAEILAVANEDRSMVVYPVNFIYECMQDPELDCTVMLAFDMLLEEKNADLKPEEYENIMEMVFRVTPKEGKTRSMAALRLPQM